MNYSMPPRLEIAEKLRDAGRVEEAAREFHTFAQELNHPDEKAVALVNEHECYVAMGALDRAKEIMSQLRGLPVQEKYVRMLLDYADAVMTIATAEYQEGISKFENVLELYSELLNGVDFRYLYEEIQRRRGFGLTTLKRYAEAIPVLEEAMCFTNATSGDTQSVYFYLGICYAGVSKTDLAKAAYLRTIDFHLMSNPTEADAHYRLSILYFKQRAFGQSKYHLEAALQMPELLSEQLKRFIYQQMSRTCHYLGDVAEEEKYSRLAASLLSGARDL
jgi:tetratricopeptide (TPR) repeat protein